MSALIVIPARYASSRLPGKPLLDASGKPLIQHTYEQAKKVRSVNDVIVATDDDRIRAAVEGFGGTAVMTSPDHQSGAERVAEVARSSDAHLVINLQGDEPEIDPEDIDQLITAKTKAPSFAATLACPFPADAASGAGSPDDPAAVKALLGRNIAPDLFEARYFTRNVCAFPRAPDGAIEDPTQYYLHIGVYAFSRDSLMEFARIPPGFLENAERLEQLRILEAGEKIAVQLVNAAPPGIDTPSDYQSFLARVGAIR
ncbi:MAG: 3-deoxy-manno-octulosonate cytidylyltransferase [Pseudomonadota bacterium]